jgi:hypothetical protein
MDEWPALSCQANQEHGVTNSAMDSASNLAQVFWNVYITSQIRPRPGVLTGIFIAVATAAWTLILTWN